MSKPAPRSDAGEEAMEQLGATVRRVFPEARRGEMGGQKGWSVDRPEGAPKPFPRGTMPNDRIIFAAAARQAGLTIYIWYPAAGGIQAHRGALEKAGFKVMVGCLQWNRKAPVPWDALVPVLEGMREADHRGEPAGAKQAAPRRG